MKRLLILTGGWVVTIIGAILTPIPQPIPLLGIMMFLTGCAILTTHSKSFRRGVQYLRHHNSWLCKGLEAITKRAPDRVKQMVHMTRPVALGRLARMRARAAADAS